MLFQVHKRVAVRPAGLSAKAVAQACVKGLWVGVLKLHLLTILLALVTATSAQDIPVLSGNPASSKWFQLQTPGFKILYQPGFEQQAQRMANTLEAIREPEARTMKALPKRIPIVMQNLSSLSNGFVTLAPRRSEFFAMPTQNYNLLGGGEWMTMLAVHEYRHVVQFQRSLTGFNKLLYYAFGQEASAGLSFITAPQWFWEGDAVAIETAYTPYGRGRLPNFDLAFRTNVMERKKFSYNKQYLRSYKDFVPNHYVLGFHMVSHMRKQKSDADIWGDITGRAWSFPLPFAFSQAMKKESGQAVVPFYNTMMGNVKSLLEKQQAELKLTPYEVINPREGTSYTDYMYPQVLTDGSIAVLKSGIGDVDQILVFREGDAKPRKFITGPLNETGMLSAAANRVVWNEFRFDPRWPVKDFSVVQGFDFATKLQQQVSEKSRYAGAALSPDGEKVLTVKTDTSYRTSLVVLDYNDGRVLQQIPNPDGAFYSMARWAYGDKSLVAVKLLNNLRSIVLMDCYSFKETVLIAPSHENIGHPVLVGKYLLYNSPYSGIDNLYALNRETGQRFQVTSAKYGAYNPCLSADGKTLYYNNQGKYGMEVVKTPFEPASWKPLEEVAPASTEGFQHLVEQEGHAHLLDSVPSQYYAPVRYRKWLNAFNPHSWGAYVNNSLTRVNVGITSKDILSTTQLKAGYDFDLQERTGDWRASISMQAWYPIVDFTVIQGNRKDDLGELSFYRIDNPGPSADTVLFSRNLTFNWRETSVQGGIRLPFNLTSSKFFQNLTVSNYVGVTQVSNFENSITGGGRVLPTATFPGVNPPYWFFDTYVDRGKLIYNQFNLFYYSLMKRSPRDINSKWGVAVDINSNQTPNLGDYNGKQFSVTSYLYLPGLFKHHSLWGYWAFQSSRIRYATEGNDVWRSNYVFRNQVPLPRGLSVFRAEKMYSMSANYTMPVWYPDLALGPLLNVKRVRVNAFMDYAFADNPERRVARPNATTAVSYISTGAEVRFDVNLFRFLPEYDFGFRYSYGLKPRQADFLIEVLLGTFNF